MQAPAHFILALTAAAFLPGCKRTKANKPDNGVIEEAVGAFKEARGAFVDLQERATGGDPDAQYELADYYEGNEGDTMSAGWFQKAAEQGHGHAMGRLSALYLWGEGGVDQDSRLAVAWAECARASGDEEGAWFVDKVFSTSAAEVVSSEDHAEGEKLALELMKQHPKINPGSKQ